MIRKLKHEICVTKHSILAHMLFYFRDFVIPLFAAFSVISCNEQSDTPAPASVPDSSVVEAPRQDNDTLPPSSDTSAPIQPTRPVLRVGSHFFTLHWISWDKPGMVTIEEETNGEYSISGSQRDKNGNFITINGNLEVISPLELKFDGVIHEKVKSLNNGDTCTRKGEQVFLSTKNRRYWRLQNMANCEGSGVVDYIDIFF